MSRVAFKGFLFGTTVVIGGVTANAWGQVEGGGTVWDIPADPGVSVTINANRSAYGVTREGVFFSAALTGFDTNTPPTLMERDPTYDDKVYFFDYGESYQFTACTKILEMDAADGGQRANSRYSTGPIGAHVFRTADTHTVRLAVFELSSGKWGQGTIDVPVAEADAFFAGPRTLFVDTSGSFENAPAGAQTFTALTDAWSVLDAATDPHRIVLERGQTHEITSTLDYSPPASTTGASLRVEARPGSGPKPVIREGNIGLDAEINLFTDRSLRDATGAMSASVFAGLEMLGSWDVLTETGNWYTRGIAITQLSAASTVIDDCDISQMNMGINRFDLSPYTRHDRTVFVNDGAVEDWSNYGFFDGGTGITCLLGSRFAQNPEAIVGGSTNQGGFNSHGAFRSVRQNATVIIASDFFSSTGWSPVTAGGVTYNAAQPGARWNTQPVDPWSRLCIHASAFESGRTAANFSAANNDHASRAVNAVVDASMFVAGFLAAAAIELTHGGMTIRGSHIGFADTDAAVAPSHFIGARSSGGSTDAENLATPLRFYSNTYFHRSGQAVPAIWNGSAMSFSDVIEDNSVVHDPGEANQPFAPLEGLPAFTPRYTGYVPPQAENAPKQTNRAHGATSASIYTPQDGSPAIEAAEGALVAATAFTPDYSGGAVIDPGRNVGAV